MTDIQAPVINRAWCFRDGVLHFSRVLPQGALPIALCHAHQDIKNWRLTIQSLCRLAHDNHTYLIPGVPENADNELAACDALSNFAELLSAALNAEVDPSKCERCGHPALKHIFRAGVPTDCAGDDDRCICPAFQGVIAGRTHQGLPDMSDNQARALKACVPDERDCEHVWASEDPTWCTRCGEDREDREDRGGSQHDPLWSSRDQKGATMNPKPTKNGDHDG